MYQAIYKSPAGWLDIQANEIGITAINFIKDDFSNALPELDVNEVIRECIVQLDTYFSCKSQSFDLPLDPAGTEFQKTVWDQLQKIPFGKTTSYLQIAKALGDPNKIRAVGGANGKNPIAIIIPCHRVIGSDGGLTGYAGGMDKKRWLLTFEGAIEADLFGY